jgi:osmotically inducible lipoprotein OsmB
MEKRKNIWMALFAIGLLTATLLLTGCSKKEKTIGGALIGAGTGAGIGAAAGGTGGAVIGGATGGAAGGLIGHEMGDDEEK